MPFIRLVHSILYPIVCLAVAKCYMYIGTLQACVPPTVVDSWVQRGVVAFLVLLENVSDAHMRIISKTASVLLLCQVRPDRSSR